MIGLIGAGSHARDIAATRPIGRHVAHHREWSGTDPVLIGINDPQLRAAVAFILDVEDLAWVHPHAWLGPDVHIGPGTHVNYAVTMTRTRIGRHCTISPGATLCGDITIGNRVLIGAGAVICDRVTIGNDVVVGAGAIVRPTFSLPEGTTWVGNPARPLH